jgi:hypothetical protein
MDNFVIYTKSYAPDVEVTKRLKESIDKHNIENVPFYVSVPKSDINLFKNKLGTSGYTLIADEDIYQLTMNLDGWRTQQIIKTHFNTLKVAKNYLCPDSDNFFINDFKKSDFMATEDTIYTIMTDAPLENRIVIEGLNNKPYYGICFYRTVRAIRKMLDNESITKLYAWGPPPYPWNCQVWDEIQDMLKSNGMNMEQFFIHLEQTTGAMSREAVLYGEYLLKYRSIDIYPTGNWFLADGSPFANEKVYNFYNDGKFGKTAIDPTFIKKYYLGLGLQDGRTTREKGIDWNGTKSKEIIKEINKLSHIKYEKHINHHA